MFAPAGEYGKHVLAKNKKIKQKSDKKKAKHNKEDVMGGE